MVKLLVLSFIIITAFYSTAVQAQQCDISGIWKHSAKEAKLFIDLTSGEVAVHSHEVNPESIGLVVLKNLTVDSIPSHWQGEMFSGTAGAFVPVTITAKSCHHLSVNYRGDEVLGLLR